MNDITTLTGNVSYKLREPTSELFKAHGVSSVHLPEDLCNSETR